tara:strand:- start:408 stop:554 length:147 start_codon:yes stop_codon:yes gene_type:complete
MINRIGIAVPIIKNLISTGGPPPPLDDFILMEGTGFILMEDDSKIILE